MIPAGVGDNTTAPLRVAQGSNLVVSAAQLEGADRLQALGLEVKLVSVICICRKAEQRCANGHALNALLRFLNVAQLDDGVTSGDGLEEASFSACACCRMAVMNDTSCQRSFQGI